MPGCKLAAGHHHITQNDPRIGVPPSLCHPRPCEAELVLAARPTMMWSRARTPTYLGAWGILLVVSMSSLEGSHSHLE
jgi:hypothetical protein